MDDPSQQQDVKHDRSSGQSKEKVPDGGQRYSVAVDEYEQTIGEKLVLKFNRSENNENSKPAKDGAKMPGNYNVLLGDHALSAEAAGHVEKDSSEQDPMVCCTVCHKLFKCQHSLKFHMKYVHKKQIVCNCDICTKLVKKPRQPPALPVRAPAVPVRATTRKRKQVVPRQAPSDKMEDQHLCLKVVKKVSPAILAKRKLKSEKLARRNKKYRVTMKNGKSRNMTWKERRKEKRKGVLDMPQDPFSDEDHNLHLSLFSGLPQLVTKILSTQKRKPQIERKRKHYTKKKTGADDDVVGHSKEEGKVKKSPKKQKHVGKKLPSPESIDPEEKEIHCSLFSGLKTNSVAVAPSCYVCRGNPVFTTEAALQEHNRIFHVPGQEPPMDAPRQTSYNSHRPPLHVQMQQEKEQVKSTAALNSQHRAKELALHPGSKMVYTPFVCQLCPTCPEFATQLALKKHILTKHPGGGGSESGGGGIPVQRTEEGSNICEICDSKPVFTTLEAVKEHQILIHPTLTPSFVSNNICLLCSNKPSYITEKALRKHHKKVHPKDGDTPPWLKKSDDIRVTEIGGDPISPVTGQHDNGYLASFSNSEVDSCAAARTLDAMGGRGHAPPSTAPAVAATNSSIQAHQPAGPPCNVEQNSRKLVSIISQSRMAPVFPQYENDHVSMVKSFQHQPRLPAFPQYSVDEQHHQARLSMSFQQTYQPTEDPKELRPQARHHISYPQYQGEDATDLTAQSRHHQAAYVQQYLPCGSSDDPKDLTQPRGSAQPQPSTAGFPQFPPPSIDDPNRGGANKHGHSHSESRQSPPGFAQYPAPPVLPLQIDDQHRKHNSGGNNPSNSSSARHHQLQPPPIMQFPMYHMGAALAHDENRKHAAGNQSRHVAHPVFPPYASQIDEQQRKQLELAAAQSRPPVFPQYHMDASIFAGRNFRE